MTSKELLQSLQTADTVPDVLEAIRALQTLRMWSVSVQTQLLDQQVVEPNPSVDFQLEALSGVYKVIGDAAQTALEQCVRISSNVKHLPSELARRIEAVAALEPSI